MSTALAEGTFDVTATVTDSAGNITSDVTANELRIDSTAPVAPGVTGQTTSDTTPLIIGTATLAAGETLTVSVNDVIYSAGAPGNGSDLIDNGDGTWALTIPTGNTLAEALYQVVATVTDAAGNIAVDLGVDDLLVDFSAPDTPGVTSQSTDDTTPSIEGTVVFSPGDTLSVTVNAVTYTDGDGDLVVNADGTWTLTIPAIEALNEDLYDVTATLSDSVGNTTTDPSSAELFVFTTASTTPTVVPLITNNTTPTLTGTASFGPSSTLRVAVNGVIYTAGDGSLVDNSDGTWQLTIPTALVEGRFDVTATVTNAAGNDTTDTSEGELIIDTTPPAIPAVTSQSTNDDTPVISGTAVLIPGETLKVTVDGVTYTAGDGKLVNNGDGTWDLDVPTPLTITFTRSSPPSQMSLAMSASM